MLRNWVLWILSVIFILSGIFSLICFCVVWAGFCKTKKDQTRVLITWGLCLLNTIGLLLCQIAIKLF